MALNWIEETTAGIHIIPADLYLDPSKGVDAALISHAHGDHFNSACKELIGSPGTIALLQHRIKNKSNLKFQIQSFGENFSIGEVSFRLLPAGHIPGSSMIWMQYKGQTALYTGDFNPRPHPMAEPLEYPDSGLDLLITESTFGNNYFVGKEAAEELQELISRVPEKLPILLGVYALGKAQRISQLIHAVYPGSQILVHPFIHHYNQVYHSLGFDPGKVSLYRRKFSEQAGRTFILMPPSEFRRMAASGKYYSAFVSGWDRRRASEGIQDWLPISDHPDGNQLRTFIQKTAPKNLLPVHGDSTSLKSWFIGCSTR